MPAKCHCQEAWDELKQVRSSQYEVFGNAVFEMPNLAAIQTFSTQELRILQTMLQRQVNTPLTSSCGRLFDAIASILGLRQQTKYEGQAAIELEFVINGLESDEQYEFEILAPVTADKASPIIVDWVATAKEILEDIHS